MKTVGEEYTRLSAMLEIDRREKEQSELIEKITSLGSNESTKKQLVFDAIQENYKVIKRLKNIWAQ